MVSYPTGWYLHKRLRHAMTEEADRCQLGAPVEGGWTPIVEADDVYLGGERNEGSGTAGKTRVIAAAERHPSGRMGAVAMAVVSGFSNLEAAAFRDAHIAPGAHVYTDGTSAFHVFGEGGRTHVATVTGGKRPERERGAPFFTVNNPDLQSQYRTEGDLQSVLAQASARLPRCLLLDDQSSAQHARHDRRAMQRCRKRLPAHPPDRLRVAG